MCRRDRTNRRRLASQPAQMRHTPICREPVFFSFFLLVQQHQFSFGKLSPAEGSKLIVHEVDRQTDRQRDIDRWREKQRERGRERDRHRHVERDKDRERDRHKDRDRETKTDKQRGRRYTIIDQRQATYWLVQL